MNRREFVTTSLGSASVALAGCLGVGGSADSQSSNTVLGPPDREVEVDPEALAYPAYGQELPDVTLPSPLHDREISTREYVGSRETLLTFVFTRCGGPCPALTAALARTQQEAAQDGYGEEVVFMPTTFDPEYDTADRIREFSEVNGADPTAENWQFLRPETPERAKEVMGTESVFSVGFQRAEDSEGGHGGNPQQGEVLPPDEEGENAMFIHTNLLLLVNRDGYVERAYSPRPPRPDIVIEDLEAVRDGYS
jgi:protein SCO1/2